MSRQFRSSVNNSVCIFFLAIFFSYPAYAYKATDFNWIPPFLGKNEKPSVTIIFDNSGSMIGRPYSNRFYPNIEYYGYFDSKKYYSYNTGKQYFEPKDDPSTANLWNGNWLNWATMHRADIARKVMGGGHYNDALQCYEILSQDSADRVAEFGFDDRTPVLDLNGQANHMTPYKRSIRIDHERSSQNLIINNNARYRMRVKGVKKDGILHAFRDKMRLALFVYHREQGGIVKKYMTESPSEIDSLINEINTIVPSTWTPLAETLHTVYGYLRQDNTESTNGPRYSGSNSYTVSGVSNDPYYFSSYRQLVPCTKQSVILITDGESTQDQNIPNSLRNIVNPKPHTNAEYGLSSNGSPYLIDVAYKGHTSDLRPDLDGFQNWDFYTVFAFGSGSHLLRDAARYGRFNDKNNNNIPDLQEEYDSDGDGMPDNYFEAESGQKLEEAIKQVFQMATSSSTSGTAAAVSPQSRDGDGATYQALFFPPSQTEPIAAPWSGQVHAFLLDEWGNMREDTNQNRRIDLIEDKIIRFEGDAIRWYTDINGDGKLSAEEQSAIGSTGTFQSINDVKMLWSSSDWLNNISDTDIVRQRHYQSTTPERHILTFVDKDKNMVATLGETQDFALQAAPNSATLNLTDYFYNYLTLYESESGSLNPPGAVQSLSPDKLSSLQIQLAKRQVDFIRGAEVGNATIEGFADLTRSRIFNGKPWRLGDIIYSSPAVVSKPSENYHLIYKDKTYEGFLKKYQRRRHMVYVGANDGMLHAFNGGFYNSTAKAFDLTQDSKSSYPLGMEMWAYIPYNLLPHLKWLMNPEYGENLHVAYMDLKPRIFDARIFFLSDGVTPDDNSTHPDGWGTVLVAGMRLGGARIEVDIDKTDGNGFKNGIDRVMTSAYVILDITDPEQPPRVLAEITMPGQGFSTSYPTPMPMTTRNARSAEDNQWFLIFGSGPADARGEAASKKLGVETSDQAGQLYALDLKALVTERKIKTVDKNMNLVEGAFPVATTEAGSLISAPIAVDFDIGTHRSGEFKADVIYYGTIAGDQSSPQGKVYRLVVDNDHTSPFNWRSNVLINTKQPVTGAVGVSSDDLQRLWVFFGTGRFFNLGDISQNLSMSFYGVKEPEYNGRKTWETVELSDLFNSTRITVTSGTCGSGPYTPHCAQVIETQSVGSNATQSWNWLTSQIDNKAGWRLDFTHAWERALDQPAIMGGAVLFTSYLPGNDVCAFEGTSALWALYYKTGTAYYKPILRVLNSVHQKSIDIGKGLASTPGIQIGKKEEATGLLQVDGTVQNIDLNLPYKHKSAPLFWRER